MSVTTLFTLVLTQQLTSATTKIHEKNNTQIKYDFFSENEENKNAKKKIKYKNKFSPESHVHDWVNSDSTVSCSVLGIPLKDISIWKLRLWGKVSQEEKLAVSNSSELQEVLHFCKSLCYWFHKETIQETTHIESRMVSHLLVSVSDCCVSDSVWLWYEVMLWLILGV